MLGNAATILIPNTGANINLALFVGCNLTWIAARKRNFPAIGIAFLGLIPAPITAVLSH